MLRFMLRLQRQKALAFTEVVAMLRLPGGIAPRRPHPSPFSLSKFDVKCSMFPAPHLSHSSLCPSRHCDLLRATSTKFDLQIAVQIKNRKYRPASPCNPCNPCNLSLCS